MKVIKWMLLIVALFLFGCGPDLDGKWNASGEFYPDDPFNMVVTVQDGRIKGAHYSDLNGLDKDIVICDFKWNQETNDISFSFNPQEKVQDCNSMKTVFVFQGKMGYALISGNIIDLNNKEVGVLRALKRMNK